MADEVWKIREDGYLDLDVECSSITYHPNLNTILLLSKSHEALVIDVNSGQLLQRSSVSASHNGRLQATYIPGQDKVLFLNDRGVGVRTDYNGVLLLDTILQTPVSKGEDVVKLELLHSEAVVLQQTLISMDIPGVEQITDVIQTLTQRIVEAQSPPKRGIKAHKWNTVCVELPHCYLKWVCAGLASELKRQSRYIPALPIASAVNERLNSLLPTHTDGQPVDRSLMFSEAMRRNTFSKWPHMNYKWALPDQMAQAGFYHQPNASGDDRAMCFTCTVCLVCWEPADEPWSEHERHSPNCPFVKGEYTQNVPLSVTYATAPATPTDQPMEILGTSSVPELVPTATTSGNVTIWNCSRQLKSEATGCITSKHNYFDLRKKEAWVDQEVVEIPLIDGTLENLAAWNQETRVGAVSVVGGPGKKSEGDVPRPVLVAGVTMASKSKHAGMSSLVQAMNDVNQSASLDIMKVAENTGQDYQLYLVVCDFHYHAHSAPGSGDGEEGDGGDGSASKTVVSGTGTSASRQENSSGYPEIFLTKILCNQQVLHDVESGDVVYQTDIMANDSFPAPSSSGISCPVPLGVAVPTAGGGTFDTSMAINEGLDMVNFPSTSNSSPSILTKLIDRDSKSDAIGELGNGVEIGMLSEEPVPIQSVHVETGDQSFSVTGIHPTRDGHHILVVLRSNGVEKRSGMLLVYKLNLSEPVVTLEETPVTVRVLEHEVTALVLLPLPLEALSVNPLGVVVLVTHDGLLSLVDIATLDTLATTTHQNKHKFVSVTYCNSLERLCAATEKGSLHFFTLQDEDLNRPEESTFEDNTENCFYSLKQSTPKVSSLQVNAEVLDLPTLYELTRFENMVPCFSATVPSCWSELMQAQKQRRHPQHLQHSDDLHHTRSWRLQKDTSSWDEHILELTLNNTVCVGHVDVKFSLHAQCQVPPNIQFTLLKQNASGIGKLADNSNSVHVDSTIDFSISPEAGSKKGSATVNPVLSEEFARAHNTEILCGPISLASCLDLSEQAGTVTFTSPKLMKVRGRTLLVHIKALAHTATSSQDKDKQTMFGPGSWFWEQNGLFLTAVPVTSAVDRLASNVTNKKMEYNGCDWLHEVSITVRKTKHTDILNERAERLGMLESEWLVERLLSLVTDSSETSVRQSMAFDILLWLAAIRLSRLRPVPASQQLFVSTVQEHLSQLIHSCFIRGNRTQARKCVRLVVLCSENSQDRERENGVTEHFDTLTVKALLESLPQLCQCWSAGALRWYFALLSRLVTLDTVSPVATKALGLLRQVASHLHTRQNPYHLLLQTRFGLYGTPFEVEMFDQEAPVLAKFSSLPLGYSKVITSDGMVFSSQSNTAPVPPQSSSQTDNIDDLRDLLNMKAKLKMGDIEGRSFQSQLKCLTANHYMKGLLEVQPLHFTCHATSDGTKLEKIDSGAITGPVINYFEAPPVSPISPILTNHVASNGPKKIVDNDVERVPWQQLVVAPPQHMLVVERMHSGARRFVVLDLGYPVLLTDLFIPACPDLLSLSIDLWLVSEEQDAQRLVVATDITTKTLIMNDINPSPVVRFIKITTIGRYGMNTTKCKIPIGCFYGHLIMLPGEDYAEKHTNLTNYPDPQSQLGVLNALFEDIQCRYTLACSKLQDLLSPLLTSEIANISHMHHYLHRGSESNKPANSKITTAYQECITYQNQLNSIRSVMRRLKANKDSSEVQNSLSGACTDKLRVLGETLLDLLLHLAYNIGFMPKGTPTLLRLDATTCSELFHWLCVAEDTRMQLATSTLLVRMCGLQPWWPDFLTSTLQNLYSSQNTAVFPQDRVFILLVYLGRKSLSGGASRSTVMDSVLKTLLTQLAPLAYVNPPPGYLRTHMDLPLVGWLLLFLSQCLDSTGSSANPAEETADKKSDKDSPGTSSRWDFLQGELSMQRRMSAVTRCGVNKSYQRKLQKKLMHHKQQLEDLENAKKAFQASTQALSALSSQAAKLSFKLETALKQQEHFLKKSVKQASSSKMSKEPVECKRVTDEATASGGKLRASDNVMCLPRAHCLPVARALIALLLHMDFTCNLDTFLLTCKVLARVALWTRPSLLLGEVMSEEQLVQLVRLAVLKDQRVSTWGSPWACHAITCLLQDMLEGGIRSKRPSPEPVPIEEEQETEISKDEEVAVATSSEMSSKYQGVTIVSLPPSADTFQVPEPEEAASPSASSQGVPSVKIKINTANFPLPSLLESDDSELEDLLDDILERGRPLTKKAPAPRVPLGISSTISTALDSRLEYGVDGNTEVALSRITAHGAYNLPMSVSAPIAPPPNHNSPGVNHSPPPQWEDSLTASWQTQPTQETPSSVEMLKQCFDQIFTDLYTSQDSNTSLELVLQLWLTLNLDSAYAAGDSRAFDATVVPHVALSPTAISAFIYTLANRGGNSVRCWCLGFQALTLMSNLPQPHSDSDSNLDTSLQGMARVIVKDQHFPKLLLSFFSSPLIKGCAGVSVCTALHLMLVRLEMHCDVISASSQLGHHFKLLLLQVLDQLVSPGIGIISLHQGPLDAQAKFVQILLHLDFTSTEVTIAFSTLKSVALLVQSYMINSESAKWRSLGDNSFSSGLFNSSSTVLWGTAAAQSHGGMTNNNSVNNGTKMRLGTKECLMISILKLCVNLVQIPLQTPQSPTTSQTDEHKAASTKLPCVTDMVVQEEQTMHCLLSALGLTHAQLTETPDPSSVCQAVFLLLSTLARKVTSPEFVLKPIFSYISARDRGLSEPLLSLLLRVVDSVQALQELTSLGALQVICESLVRTDPGLFNCQPSNVSILMQHLSQAPAFMLSTSTKKSSDLGPALLNFAPLGVITSSNPTAQPADVLIQSTPPHRRARAPAWSYHFYPEENWVELTVTLPCAVLLREVHLQPHLTSLATCPSGVGLEISRDGRSPLVPVNLPLDSSGLTFIRLQLPQPEVVTTVLLRLYKPRDASNIGLLQIRLLGHTTFTDMTSADDDAQATDSSLMWVRLLYHCMTVAGSTDSQAQAQAAVISAVPGLLQACCGLLLVPTPSSVTPCLQHVLYTLGTHRSELGLQIITTLLDNGSTQFYQGGLSSGVSSVVDLLYLLCSTQDAHTEERLSAVLGWLQTTAGHGNVASCTYVQCVAAIIWANPGLQHLLTNSLFSLVYQWTLKLEPRSALKRSVDMVLCAMCYVKPVLFPTLLQHMGALVPISATNHAASISDDRKDGESGSLTDDSKKEEQEMSEWYNQLVLQDLEHLQLSDSQLMTIAVACQSPPATLQLLDSGLPNLLTSAILEFCSRKHMERRCSKQNNQSRLTDSDKANGRNHIIKEGRRPMVHLDMLSTILQFFAEVCSEGIMRDWLGSSKGSEFWLPLLTVLCNKPTSSRCEMTSESFSTLESATVKFLSRCCWCHPTNQRLLATVLCDVISQQKTQGDVGISGVTRRLVLQLLLESEKVPVCVQGSTARSASLTPTPSSPIHPRHGVGHSNHLFYLSIHTTCADIVKLVASTGSGNSEAETGSAKENSCDSPWNEVTEQVFVAAGITAKDKRIKNADLHSFLKEKYLPYANFIPSKQANSSTSDEPPSTEGIQHKDIPGMILPPNFSLSQLLTALDQRGTSLSSPCLELQMCDTSTKETWVSTENKESLLSMPQFPSPLQVFTQQGGLALLAEHLPLVYPETLLYFRSSTSPTAPPPQASDQVDADWVKVEATDDIYEDVEESMVYMPGSGGGSSGGGTSKHSEAMLPTVPLHSLAAFALFLRLPGYAEVLLKDKRKAQCLLRLVLGVSDDGEGSDILSNPASNSLPTLPFEVLRQLLESTPLSTDDGVLLRRTALDHGALHLLLTCLAVFTHQPHTSDTLLPGISSGAKSSSQNHQSDDKSHLYWAKGTGFGTGSTTQSWNVEQALSRQRSEEQHVTVLLQVLSSYINPGGVVTTDSSDDDSDTPTKPVPPQLPSCIHDLLQQSCLLPALSSYLRNDSVLDMARHIPLYRSVLQLLRALAQNCQLVSLLLPRPKHASLQLSATCLLLKMKHVVDTYASRLKINKPKNQKKMVRVSSKQQEESTESDEGLALLIPDIQETANLVQSATEKLVYESESDSNESGLGHDLELPVKKSLEQRYLEVMKPLQFETYEMITEATEGNGFQFVVSYHFESNVRGGGDRSHPARVKRLAQETVTLSTSLPLSFSSSVFVRCDADRLDIMKVLITGPAETPYANGCFELDVYFPPDYPNSPMMINLETTGHHTIRFNPNLYNDGKVCLSVLNTWHGRPEEKWNAHTSSFLQVLVSIQSLILVPEPYFNEPGYERSRGTQAGNQSSREYNSNICQATVKWAMLEQLRNPSPCFKQVIQTHFWMKRKEIKSQIEAWIKDMESQSADRRTGRTISLNTMALKRHYQQLCEELAKLKPPPGLEDLADAEEPTWQQDMEKIVSQVLE